MPASAASSTAQPTPRLARSITACGCSTAPTVIIGRKWFRGSAMRGQAPCSEDSFPSLGSHSRWEAALVPGTRRARGLHDELLDPARQVALEVILLPVGGLEDLLDAPEFHRTE